MSLMINHNADIFSATTSDNAVVPLCPLTVDSLIDSLGLAINQAGEANFSAGLFRVRFLINRCFKTKKKCLNGPIEQCVRVLGVETHHP